MKMGKGTAATIVFLVAFGAYIAYRSAVIPEVECRVCVTFQGETTCRTAASGTREAAVESAQTSACGTLANGMAESIRCSNTTPDSAECRD
jgi:hypothetical protein